MLLVSEIDCHVYFGILFGVSEPGENLQFQVEETVHA